jgi:acetylornithine deacetylase/succinyl-diaminopimelate desuccinylase-like protein
LSAGYKANVVPSVAEAIVDVRPLPGRHEAALAAIQEIMAGRGTVDPIHVGAGVEAPFDVPLTEAMTGALRRADPSGVVLPYLLSAGTDAKSLAELGVKGYGFVPLKLPADFDFTAMFHGVDERVPADSVDFGARVLADFLANC